MITYKHMDITTVDFGVIAHGVNCQKAMGSGVALAIKTKWPEVYKRYMSAGKGVRWLGYADVVEVEKYMVFVANCYTQLFYGKGGRFASPEAIRTSLNDVYAHAQVRKLPLYLPKIGAGLGGLSWENEVLPIIEKLSDEFDDVETIVCEWP